MKKNILMMAAVIVMTLSLSSSAQVFFMQNPNVGKPAEDFTLKTVGGGETTFQDVRDGGKAIVFFWATWCPHCREALGKLRQSQQELKDQKIKLILVDVGEEEAAVKSYLDRNKIDMEVFLDEQTDVSGLYGVIGIPTFYFVGEDGIIRKVQNAFPQDLEQSFYGG